ncbi:hypothetical protein L2520_03665 [Limosilactobacillus vaginalis]|uniref:Uncharacterized protein n=2 Tax=Limosilactobacillus vaginalis TaxID=1633 RepID=A0ABT4K8D9_9LACO|nr:hypothetical protein [Limosilactobacillus vaginalis]MCZ3746520.1 hypothetical protein [Limosilactobacillus vaginalis]MCZ3751588.1 hypothetical protein [Limosilactobacillus vaginalis]MCZ3753274.1 hypothetical protein [Limosilactobacillus vaginalis]MCZ3755040.1 hypothetical protein [Limosilactobacillus vaginalis]MCZ3756760.1 hypothetical protein [Limosilactobacillus vaginalis]
MDKSYNEIIYLNEIELTSALAQLNKGYVNSLISKSNSTSKNGETDTSNNGVSASAGVKGLLSGEYTGKSSHQSSSENDESFGKDLNIVLNDYNLKNLISSLKSKKMLKGLRNSAEGDFVFSTSSFTLTDFNFTTSILSDPKKHGLNPTFRSFMKDVGAWDKSTEATLKLISDYMKFGQELTQGNILVKMDGLTAFANDNHFRLNNGELQSLSYSSREMSILGIAESKLSDDIVNDSENFIKKKVGTENNDLSKIGNIVPSITELLFFSSGLLKKGDRFVKPIALFFN